MKYQLKCCTYLPSAWYLSVFPDDGIINAGSS